MEEMKEQLNWSQYKVAIYDLELSKKVFFSKFEILRTLFWKRISSDAGKFRCF